MEPRQPKYRYLFSGSRGVVDDAKSYFRMSLMYDTEMDKHFTDEIYTSHNGIVLKPYPECPERTQGIWRSLTEAGLVEDEAVLRLETGRLVMKEECCLVHRDKFWEDWLDSESLSQEERETLAKTHNSIYLNQDSIRCARLAAGGVLQCVDSVMKDEARSGWAVVRPPGHHADETTSAGFCLLNNVAIAAKYATTKFGLDRVMILDWDVHHGNGTQQMFYTDPSVLYISLHRYDHGKFYPSSTDANYDKVGEGEGEGFNINIPWNGAGFGDYEYMQAFKDIIMPVAKEYNPELILISAGFDAAIGDPLSGYQVSPPMYGFMTHQLSALAGGRLVIALEGGYNLDVIATCATMCGHALMGQTDKLPCVTATRGRETRAQQSADDTVRDVIKTQSKYWKSLDPNPHK